MQGRLIWTLLLGLAIVIGIPVPASQGRIAPHKFGDVWTARSIVIFDKAEQC